MAGCGSSSSGPSAAASPAVSAASSAPSPSATSSPSAAATSTAPSVAPITVLVSNDDGVHAPGIDALVQALGKQPEVTVKVVAPLTNQSGTGGKTTKSLAAGTDTRTLSGYPAVGVPGTPADSVNYALDRLNLKPDIVMTGANLGQNLGPVADLSGTVGAARAGARQGIPALAVSAGFAKKVNYAGAAAYAMKWLRAERKDLPASASAGAAEIQALNVPSCTSGSVRGELTLPDQPKLEQGQSIIGASDCTSKARPTTEVAAFTAGFATLVTLPLNPSS